MPRFTISRHTAAKDGDHYDLMLEHGDALRTWRIESTGFQRSQPASPIPDHRKMYLDYEGEVSRDRGRVAIWDTGTYETGFWEEERIQVTLSGRRGRTTILLQHQAGAPAWTLATVPQAP